MLCKIKFSLQHSNVVYPRNFTCQTSPVYKTQTLDDFPLFREACSSACSIVKAR